MPVRSEWSEVQAGTLTSGVLRPMSAKPMRFAAVYAKITILEFLAVAAAGYLSGVLYQYTALNQQTDLTTYIPTALFIAALVCIVSIGFRHFVAIQRQPLHLLLWNGIGAVALAFTFFLTALFLLKAIGEYPRGAFIFQVLAVSVTVCLTRTMSYFWLQSAIRSGAVEARHVVLIGNENNRLQFADLVRTAGVRSIASLSFPHHSSPLAGLRGALIDRKAARQTIEFCRSACPDDIVILASPE